MATTNTDSITENAVTYNSKKILMNHLGSFLKNDLEAVVSDYTNESVFITQDATYTGPREIKLFFANLLEHFPKDKFDFHLDKLVVVDTMAFIVWHATTPTVEVPLGTDTFIIKDGKIIQQTFCGQLKFK